MRLHRLTSAIAIAAMLAPAPAAAGPSWGAPLAVPAPSGGIRDRIRGAIISLASVFTAVGTSIVTARMIQTGTAPKNIGWGTGTTAAATTDTDLVAESVETLSGNRVVGTESRVTITNANDTYEVTGTVTATGGRAIAEAGLFNGQSVGTGVPNANGSILVRSVFGVLNLVTNDSVVFTFQLKFNPG